jgi:hypothetical protein
MFLALVPIPLRNKYILISILFTIWLCFFDENSLIEQYKREITLQKVTKVHNFYTEGITESDKFEGIRLGDTTAMEKIAREQYFMKKDDEDVFVIITEEEWEEKKQRDSMRVSLNEVN